MAPHMTMQGELPLKVLLLSGAGAAVALFGLAALGREARVVHDKAVLAALVTPGEGEGGYDVQDLKLPKLSGWTLRVVLAVMRTPLVGRLVLAVVLKQQGVGKVKQLAAGVGASPIFLPIRQLTREEMAEHTAAAAQFDLAFFESLPVPPKPSRRELVELGIWRRLRASDYTDAYRSGRASPENVIKQLVRDINESNASGLRQLNAFIDVDEGDAISQAADSGLRWRAGEAIGPLDGVPIGVKDVADIIGYKTGHGTRFLTDVKGVASSDSICLARLRAAGAILIGKCGMQELGIGTHGANVFQGSARNPHHPAHFCGGSSSGCAAAIASGLIPIAIGADGGGSIRIPAACTGIYGLKPTYGRIPVGESKSNENLTNSVGCIGPMAATIEDIALVYMVMSGQDPQEAEASGRPPPHIQGFDQAHTLSGVRVGVCEEYFDHADPRIVARGRAMLAELVKLGAVIVPIELHNLDAIRIAHLLTISAEIAVAMDKYSEKEFTAETSVYLNMASQITARDYLSSQKVRRYATDEVARVFASVDLVALPSTAIIAPPIEDESLGVVDIPTLGRLARFSTLANFVGLPAISVPAGKAADSALPVGFQLIAPHYQEALLLRAAKALASSPETLTGPPQVCFPRPPKL
eukprot:CAMPEP_0180285496 /NCGR_PEP_ID=MMETSP0988-20121125/11945_1 /TAXON_ID=697907 /ORGANISM="non described non described, Strain CCMP2293" /LENGTH=639 /DNA_ID=CAMNT_0022258909 /DNA_START=51 /DNA_END=1970 /DNA_ORIENTATION=+